MIAVTSLADSGAGTLRKALEAQGARIVVFRTSGIITLESPLVIREPHVTVAGQKLGWPTVLPGQPYADGDADGMADEWERERGLGVSAPDGQLDPDGDGYTHLDEFLNRKRAVMSSPELAPRDGCLARSVG